MDDRRSRAPLVACAVLVFGLMVGGAVLARRLVPAGWADVGSGAVVGVGSVALVFVLGRLVKTSR